MRQFFLATVGAPPAAGQHVLLDRDESHHALTVLRRGDRDPVGLVDGRGLRLTARLAGRDGKLARLEILTVAHDEAEQAAPRLWLACGVVKGRRWEWVLEKAVELGAHRITPLLCEHGVVEPREGRRERWLGVLRAALKQSGRAWLPELDEPQSLADWLAGGGDWRLFYGAVPAERDAVAAEPTATAADAWLAAAIGPEGGWAPAERTALQDAGAAVLDLGPHVLRTETAAAAALALLQAVRRRAVAAGDP
ncbi:MAG: 16S rRNA (uracil(1498)-N(3))-methyltransferase [Candidatus Krumholzibacteriia bacterium]